MLKFDQSCRVGERRNSTLICSGPAFEVMRHEKGMAPRPTRLPLLTYHCNQFQWAFDICNYKHYNDEHFNYALIM